MTQIKGSAWNSSTLEIPLIKNSLVVCLALIVKSDEQLYIVTVLVISGVENSD